MHTLLTSEDLQTRRGRIVTEVFCR